VYEKRCPKCNSSNTNKIGTQSGRPRYLCRKCKSKFQDKKRSHRLKTHKVDLELWEKYTIGKQTYNQLATKEGLTKRIIARKINNIPTPTQQPYEILKPGPIVLVIDGFFYSKQEGLLVFRASNLKINLMWLRITTEKASDYLYGVQELRSKGWYVIGFVVDGKKGVVSMLNHIAPVQYCQVHQIRTVIRYLTSRPQTKAAQELLKITRLLTYTDEDSFKGLLGKWLEKHRDFINEKTDYPDGTQGYTHSRVRSAYSSITRNLDHLFTRDEFNKVSMDEFRNNDQRNPRNIKLPNSTNTIDGIFGHIRTKTRVHSGIKLELKFKLTDKLLRK
jgi:hypothetical protein